MSAINNTIKRVIKQCLSFGTTHLCPVCGSRLRTFKPYGAKQRPNAICPICGSLERHRLMWLYLINETDLFNASPKKMLHIAPEACFTQRLQSLDHLDYLAGDLFQPDLMKIDITDIQFPDHHFDVIYCSHVLEHVPNDRQAMQEFVRVLRPSGWAILQVPIRGDQTDEDLTIIDPEERTHRYGQPDHVRYYGRDYKERLEGSGFHVSVIPYSKQFSKQTFNRYGFSSEDEDIYLCTR